MANAEHLARLRVGVRAWNDWRREHPGTVPDLRGALLSGADLVHADLFGADLREAHLEKASLEGARLTGADLTAAHAEEVGLSDADLYGAQMDRAKLHKASLYRVVLLEASAEGADLRGANMLRADLTQAKLNDANLTEAWFGGTIIGDNDVRRVIGLETIGHRGPSTIGINTLHRSQGDIPETFLRGCGVPENFILYARSLAVNPIQFYSCFISYSTKDQAFADRLHSDLQNKGVRCWFAPHDIQSGRKLHEQIDEAIRLHDKLLLILSPHSMESEWVKTEIAKARKREVRDQRRVLFPIRLAPFETLRDWECFDADTGKDSAREIREYFIPDFSNWKNHDSYQEAFQRLISDLKASNSKPK